MICDEQLIEEVRLVSVEPAQVPGKGRFACLIKMMFKSVRGYRKVPTADTASLDSPRDCDVEAKIQGAAVMKDVKVQATTNGCRPKGLDIRMADLQGGFNLVWERVPYGSLETPKGGSLVYQPLGIAFLR
ncbi:hypothetical protein JTE90_027579 [Oedothorax gibbosus]|uniref:Uncharacterized protein n=1 Tax=Oedothorax gibbosus TaxID=931172 RepID=A0AAV6VJW6_9ARAC|nr:hypothetical protein JTE90_027579 [Oedothorax gibbosus]